MKKLTILLFFILCTLVFAAVPAAAYPDPAVKAVYSNEELDGYQLPYNLILPEDYDESQSYPVILLLHGAGERGNDNEKQMFHVVDELFETRPELLADTIMLVPQCPTGEQWVNWPWADGNYSTDEIPESSALSSAIKLLGVVLEEYACDLDRVYIMGISMGGYGTWDALVRHEELFAAGVPLCGGGDESKANILKEVPIWCVHGDADPTVQFAGTEGMYNAIIAAGGDRINFEPVEGGEHNIWDYASTNGELIDWLFEQNLTLRYPHETEPVTETEPVIDTSIPDNSGNSAVIIIIAVIAVVGIGAAVIVLTGRKKSMKNK